MKRTLAAIPLANKTAAEFGKIALSNIDVLVCVLSCVDFGLAGKESARSLFSVKQTWHIRQKTKIGCLCDPIVHKVHFVLRSVLRCNHIKFSRKSFGLCREFATRLNICLAKEHFFLRAQIRSTYNNTH
jgi:hypothetical protein